MKTKVLLVGVIVLAMAGAIGLHRLDKSEKLQAKIDSDWSPQRLAICMDQDYARHKYNLQSEWAWRVWRCDKGLGTEQTHQSGH